MASVGRDNLGAFDLQERTDVAQTTRSPARNADPKPVSCLAHRLIFILVNLSLFSHRRTPKKGLKVHLMVRRRGEKSPPHSPASEESGPSCREKGRATPFSGEGARGFWAGRLPLCGLLHILHQRCPQAAEGSLS